MYRILFSIIFQFIFVLTSMGQLDTIHLKNASFEGLARLGDLESGPILPNGWFDCGGEKFPNESPPDIHPVQSSAFGVTTLPDDGKTYLGLVVRDNDTYESVAQQLRRSLKKGKCYEFKIHLARSKTYVSASRETGKRANYTTPATFRIYGGYGYCQEKELLGETPVVISERWLEYRFRFEPQGNYDYLVFQAYYRTPSLNPYNGNLLLDNATDIYEIHCDEVPVEEEIAEADPIVEVPAIVKKKVTPKPVKKENTKPQVTQVTKPKIIPELEKDNIKEGQTIRINKLYFKADSTRIEPESHDVLMELYDFLVANPNVKVEVGGHSNTIPPHAYCDKISTARAKSVADFLIAKGIKSDRLIFKGYGKRKALTKSTTKWGRQRNQRVEIKILRI